MMQAPYDPFPCTTPRTDGTAVPRLTHTRTPGPARESFRAPHGGYGTHVVLPGGDPDPSCGFAMVPPIGPDGTTFVEKVIA